MDPGEAMKVLGFEIPIKDTPFGPRVAASDDDDTLDRVQWAVNAALDGDLPGLIESLERGEARDDDAIFLRPAGPEDDLAAAGATWRARTGTELGDDVYCIALRWRWPAFFLPRQVLIKAIRRLEALRAAAPKPPPPWLFQPKAIHRDPHPDEEAALRALEPRAAALDALAALRGDLEHAATVAAKRRFLLVEIEEYGILTGPMGLHRAAWLERWGLPTLLAYQRAVVDIGRYWASAPRRARVGPPPLVPSVLGTGVSPDWFRLPGPTPPGWDPDDWLAFCERALLDADLGDAYEGEIFIHQSGGRFSIRWRRDDAVNPWVVAATAR